MAQSRGTGWPRPHALAAALGLGALVLAGLSTPLVAGTDATARLEAEVLAPFRADFVERNARGEAHAHAIDEGRAHLVEGPGFGADEVNRRIREHGFDFPAGWVMRVVRPFEGDYFTTQRSRYELVGWRWAEGREGVEARVSYRETLWLKAEDSFEAVAKAEWQPWLTIDHHLRVERDGTSWSAVAIAAPTPTPGGVRRRNFYEVPTPPPPH